MAISVRCACGKTYKVKPELAGRAVRCAACGSRFSVPQDTPGLGVPAPLAEPTAPPDDLFGDLNALQAPLGPSLPSANPPSPATAIGPSASASQPTLKSAWNPATRAKGIDRRFLLFAGIGGGTVVAVVFLAIAALLPRGLSRKADLSTPERAFDAFNRAELSEDHRALYDLVTPESQEIMVGVAVIALYGSLSFDKGAAALLKKHGLVADKPPLELAQPISSPATEARAQFAAVARHMAAGIKDPRSFYLEAVEFFRRFEDKSEGDGRGLLAVGFRSAPGISITLNNVVLEGDRARATRSMIIDGERTDDPIAFRRLNGEWRVDVAAAWLGGQ